ncbi:Fe-S cluster assembly ATPase SufC [Candidatus Gottesmanbacteria bacterium]|nr:Fe-S cluster assembly ATPase SufC [Candidatus Gottesmanbacteria bacterium]
MKHTLTIENLHVYLEKKEILKGISLQIKSGEVHALMGPNGSGKSTLAQALMGHPSYKFHPDSIGIKFQIDKTDMRNLSPDKRARAGLFLAFQNPIPVPGVTVANLLKNAFESLHGPKTKDQRPKTIANPALQTVWKFNEELAKKADLLHIPHEFLRRSINESFSGGEKKKLEMLQALVLKPKFVIFDEIDTGLDIDALKIVAQGINILKKNGTGVLMITHYQRILKYITPNIVHILINGKIVKTGGPKLAQELEEKGYAHITNSN